MRTSRRASQSASFSQNLIFSFGINMAVPIVSLITAPILARSLGVDGRGMVAAAVAPLLFVVAVGALGLPDAIIYFVAKSVSGLKQIAVRSSILLFLLGSLCGIGVWAVSGPLAAGNEVLEQLILLTAWAIPLNFLAYVPRGLALGMHRWRLSAMITGTSAVLRLVIYLSLWSVAELSPMTVVLIILTMPVLEALVYLPFLRRGATPAATTESPGYGDLLSFGARLWFGSLAGVILTRLDQLLMVPLSSEAQLGLYVVAVSIGEAPGIIASAVRGVILPTDAAEENPQHAAERLQRVARITSFMTFLAALALGASCWWWLPPLFGEDFRAAIPATLVLLLASVLGSAGSVGGAGLSARGKPELRSLSMAIAAVANVVVFLLLIGPLGALGAAISTLVGNLIAGNLNLIWLSRRFGMPLSGFFGIHRADLQMLWSLASRALSAGKPGK